MRSIVGITPATHLGEQRRSADPTERDVRAMLRTLRRPFLLDENKLAIALKRAYGSATPVAAVHDAIKEAIGNSPAFGGVYSEIIQRCDVRAQSTKQAAAAMSMSIRTFFRFRKDALTTVVVTVRRRIDSAAATTSTTTTSTAPEAMSSIHRHSDVQAAS